jgi:amidase
MSSPSFDVMTAAEIARQVNGKRISPTEVLEGAIARIEARNPVVNAFVYTAFDEARAAAKALEARLARGENLGALAGVPTAMKDLFGMYPGWPNTIGGIPSLKSNLAEVRSVYPKQVEAAGAIMLGITNSPIFGYRGTTDNPLFGATHNPFDLTRNSGGSSGGSAAAVADGLIPIGGANDGGGSIRIPSAWCGVFGFQSSFGRVPGVVRPNAFEWVSPFVYDGAVARTVEDGALAMAALAAYDSADVLSDRERVDWVGATKRSIKGLRIGFSPDLSMFPVDPKIAAVIGEAVGAFREQGAKIVPLKFDLAYSRQELTEAWMLLVGVRMAGALDGMAADGHDIENTPGDLPDVVLDWVKRARAMTMREIQQHQILRTAIFDAFHRAFDQVNLIVTPTVAAMPVKNGARGETVGPNQINGEAVDPFIGWCLTFFTNMTGNPAASIPAGLVDSLPVGMQIIGPTHGDVNVLAASAAFEQARPWLGIYGTIRR